MGLTTTRALFLYDPAVGGGWGGISLPTPPPPLTGLNPPPPLASFAGSKSRTSFSWSVSFFETSFSSFIFRLPFCCCEPHRNVPLRTHQISIIMVHVTQSKNRSRDRIHSTPTNSLRPRRNHCACGNAFFTTARKRMSANIILNVARAPSGCLIKLSQRSCLQSDAGCC